MSGEKLNVSFQSRCGVPQNREVRHLQSVHQGTGTVTNRKLLAATALQTGALALFASAAPAFAQTTPPATVQNPPAPADQTTVSTQPSTVVPVSNANNATTSSADTNIVITGSRIRRPN